MRRLLLSGLILLFPGCSDPDVRIDDATETPAAVPTQNSEYDVVVDPAAGDTLMAEPIRPTGGVGETAPYNERREEP